MFLFVQGEGKPRQSEMEFTQVKINGKIRGETRVEDDVTKIEGIIEGNVDGSIKKTKSEETGTINGKIEKARIQGEIQDNKINATIIEGIIKGVTIFQSEGDRTIERIIENGSFKVDIGNIGEGIKFEKSIENVQFEGGDIEEYSHYNTFKICKIYVENAHESEYRLWPVIEDPSVS